MYKYLLIIPIVFMFNGCSGHCISLFNDTCVIERDVPGPTKIVYKKCELGDVPPEPVWRGPSVMFKEIKFDDKVYYGITKSEAVTLDVNMINSRAYKKSLRAVIMKYKQPKKEIK